MKTAHTQPTHADGWFVNANGVYLRTGDTWHEYPQHSLRFDEATRRLYLESFVDWNDPARLVATCEPGENHTLARIDWERATGGEK